MSNLKANKTKQDQHHQGVGKNQDSSEGEIQVDLIDLTCLMRNPRLFKLMSSRWNKHSKWAIGKMKRFYLSCLQLARSRGVYIEL
jgi:hypothetical protein